MVFKVAYQLTEIITFIAAIILMAQELGQLSTGEVSEKPLRGGKQLFVELIALVNPIAAGAIFYYGWRKRLPLMAKTANHFSFLGFFLLIAVLLYIVL